MILSYDPTADEIDKVKKVEIAPSGRQHLQWALRDWVYIEAMGEITPLYDHPAAETIRTSIAGGLAHLRRRTISTFLNYLLQDDAHFCLIPKHGIYKPQEANSAPDAFININDIIGTKPEFLNEGTSVEYDTTQEEKGPHAINVDILMSRMV